MSTPTDPTLEKAWKAKFLAALAEHPSVKRAAKRARVHRSTVYAERQADPAFAAAWADARERGLDALEDTAMERTADSDTMMIFMLKAWRPERYREQLHLSGDLAVTKGYTTKDASPDAWDTDGDSAES